MYNRKRIWHITEPLDISDDGNIVWIYHWIPLLTDYGLVRMIQSILKGFYKHHFTLIL